MTTEAYLGLRQRALSCRKSDVYPGVSGPAGPWSVVMDACLPRGVATVVAVADGSASLYLSTGGGYLGGGQTSSVRELARTCVEEAGKLLAEMRPALELSLPPLGETVFYCLTEEGLLSARTRGETLAAGGHALSGLFAHFQALIHALGRASSDRAPNGG
jgi:hypothetical protein